MDKLSNSAAMNSDHPKWPKVTEAARALGVGDWAIRKWAQRGTVPPKWQLAIIKKTKGEIGLSDFNHSEPAQ